MELHSLNGVFNKCFENSYWSMGDFPWILVKCTTVFWCVVDPFLPSKRPHLVSGGKVTWNGIDMQSSGSVSPVGSRKTRFRNHHLLAYAGSCVLKTRQSWMKIWICRNIDKNANENVGCQMPVHRNVHPVVTGMSNVLLWNRLCTPIQGWRREDTTQAYSKIECEKCLKYFDYFQSKRSIRSKHSEQSSQSQTFQMHKKLNWNQN